MIDLHDCFWLSVSLGILSLSKKSEYLKVSTKQSLLYNFYKIACIPLKFDFGLKWRIHPASLSDLLFSALLYIFPRKRDILYIFPLSRNRRTNFSKWPSFSIISLRRSCSFKYSNLMHCSYPVKLKCVLGGKIRRSMFMHLIPY